MQSHNDNSIFMNVPNKLRRLFQSKLCRRATKPAANSLQIPSKLSQPTKLASNFPHNSQFSAETLQKLQQFPIFLPLSHHQLPTFVFHQLRLRSAGDSQHNTWSHSNSNLHRNFASLKAVEKVFPVFLVFCFRRVNRKRRKGKSSGGEQTVGKRCLL
jgi:hypothetical protein